MIERIISFAEEHREPFYLFLRRLRREEEVLVRPPELAAHLRDFLATDAGSELDGEELEEIVTRTAEATIDDPLVYLAIRPEVGRRSYIEIDAEEMRCRKIGTADFLAAQERVVGETPGEARVLEVDMAPFERGFPKLSQARSIGAGVEYLNRYLAGRLFREGGEGRERLFDFLRMHELHGRPLMLNGVIEALGELAPALKEVIGHLETAEGSGEEASGDAGPGGEWQRELRRLGFAPGWGRTAESAREMMELLLEILEAPSADTLGEFLQRVPMINSIAIVSPHGYFGQRNVLGKPDTGGQVVYILDQVRALEREMRASLREQGLDIAPRIVVLSRLIPEAGDTTCDQRLEHITGTEHAKILRVPFRTADGEVVREWISRFDLWPYLERYAREAERELLAELGGRPDFIVGNYSDGNLVSSLMAESLGVTQCTIAHALEKTKYPNSDIRWREFEKDHHFSCQYTADLIAMNTADFIITSSYQEIAGTADSEGQYESYSAFTMPGLYRVVSGIDCYDPKFNIVSPGANAEVFFPWDRDDHRPDDLRREIRELVFGDPAASYRGSFEDPDRPLLFAMSRLDRVKNMPGLVCWYGECEPLREEANLLLVGGHLDPERSTDRDEKRQIDRMHAILDRYDLDDRVRWIEMQTDKNCVGELYRTVADTRGAFVQPALYEAFGLTVVEAMSSGLPPFVTCFGGPSEIVEDGVSGFHIDPTQGGEAAERMVDFFRRCAEDADVWTGISEAAIERVQERYNWELYASTLLKLSRIYGFWRYITSLEREETHRYLEMFYRLMFRPLAERVAVASQDPPVV